ncbi:MAG: tetratricopeptide repeat protein [Candidatus Lokiarchaeota archaeon]|nr:tetratricopeptide repeat protein [Candidatus Lokiarchaeota archaeon]
MLEKEQNLIESLISIGRYNEAFNKIVKSEKLRCLSNQEILQKYYAQIFIYLDKGEFKEGWNFADKMIKEAEHQNNTLGLIDALIGKIENGLALGKYKESKELINKADFIFKKSKNNSNNEFKKRKGYLIFLEGRIHQQTNEIFKAIKLFKESIDVREEVQDKFGILYSLLNWGLLANYYGDSKEAEECHSKSLKIAEELHVEAGIIWNTLSLGWINYHSRKIDLAIQNAEKILSISELKGYKYVSTHAFDLIGHCYNLEGNIQKALYFFQKSLIIRQEEEYNHLIPQSYFSIGYIYSQKGDLKKSLEYFNKGLKTPSVENRNTLNPAYLISMGKVHGELGDYTTAKRFLLQALDLLNNKNILFYHFLTFHISLAKAYHYLIVLSINNNDKENIEDYLTELFNLSENNKGVKQIKQIYSLDKAILLISNNRLMDIMSAGKILKEIIGEKVIAHEIIIEAMLNLCEVLLYELKITGNVDILNELTEILDKLLNIAQTQYLHVLLSETYLMKARISLLHFDINNTRSFLTKAEKIANQHDLKLLANKISHEHDLILNNLENWENKEKLDMSLTESLKNTRYEFLFSKMIRKKIEELPIGNDIPFYFIILGNLNGQSLYERVFKENQINDGNLIAGFISAINIYGKEAFSTTGSIDRIKHGDNTIIFRSVDSLTFVYVFRGSSYSAVNKLDNFIKKIKAINNLIDTLNQSIYSHIDFSEEIKSNIDHKIDEVFL